MSSVHSVQCTCYRINVLVGSASSSSSALFASLSSISVLFFVFANSTEKFMPDEGNIKKVHFYTNFWSD